MSAASSRWKLKSLITGSAGIAAMLIAASGSAQAVPVATNFTWSPMAIGLTGGDITNAAGYSVNDYATIATAASGAFTESGDLSIINFTDSTGNLVSSPGLNSSYSIYLQFNATGNQGGPIPNVGSTTTGTFSTLQFALYAVPSSTPTFSTSTSGVMITNNAGAEVIATGSLDTTATNTVTLTNATTGISPTANIQVSFLPCTSATQSDSQGTCAGNESAFFVSPSASTLQVAVGNFSATPTRASFSGTDILIAGGAGNVTQAVNVTPVPEPASFAIIGAGFLGLGLIRRKPISRG